MHNPPAAIPAAQDPAAERAAFERLLLLVTFLLIFLLAARTPLDTDMWWHLSAGEEMLRGGKILLTDPFSFTRAGAAWTNVNWLSQIGMAAVYNAWGYLGLSAAVALIAGASMAFTCLQCGGPALLKSCALLLGSVVASVVWSPRPQILSLLLTALVGYVLYLYKWRARDRLWALPLIFLAWGNLHGGFPLGLIWIGAAVGGEILNQLLALPVEARLPWRKIARLILWGCLSAGALLLSPNGVNTWLLPFQTVDLRVLQQTIPEWASPDFHNLLEQSLLWLLLATFAAVALAGRSIDGGDLLALLGFGALALLAKRNFGPFALAAVPILCRYGGAAWEGWRARTGRPERALSGAAAKGGGFKKAVNLLIVAVLGLVAMVKLYAVSQPRVVEAYLARGFPARAAAWVRENRPPQRILNEYAWGGYSQWALPGYPVFVDGRTDLFGDAVVGEWLGLVYAGEGWQEALDAYHIDLLLLQPDRPLLSQLGPEWRRLYADEQVVVYGR